ncbi:helix-turn-helix domain-containing protein [Bailinhaonella thermotolerans]|uniref:Helix-turn-helix domain-containing protein n=1 Tax=Bailinhaonella thermotolerans TaxID=1070861 RepID=A0A3A4A4X1_9ACTN|nr:helix-turn-helix domain-containing protein [Bailinhaonella thermotolerans]RJL22010.1 helix-turn-helix domain-containing protein [Bailinhaonella thermotolerans]
MGLVTYRTHDLPQRDRFPYWQELANGSYVPALLRSDRQEDFRGAMRILLLGEVLISLVVHDPLEVIRTERMVRRTDAGLCVLSLSLAGRGGLSYGDRSSVHEVGEMCFYDSSRPIRAWREGGPGRSLVLQFPRAWPGLPRDFVPELAGVTLDARCGVGGLLAAHLSRVIRDAPDYTEAEEQTVARMSLDLVAATLAYQMDQADALTPETARRVLLRRIDDFIERRLGDPELTPAVVAAAHHISLRYLHRLFQERGGPSVAALIRRSRLERCRRDLADPRMSHHSLAAIAARWGLTDRAAFSRLFRSAYGLPPGEYRRACARGEQCADFHIPGHE